MIEIMARKNYSMEFRQQAVDLYETRQSATLKQTAGKVGGSRGTLALRVKDLGDGLRASDGPTPATPACGESPVARIDRLEPETARLRADKAQVKSERDILRKAAKYFAGETNW